MMSRTAIATRSGTVSLQRGKEGVMGRGTVGQDGPLLEQRGGQEGTAGLWAGRVAVTIHSVYRLETVTQAHSPCAALCRAEEPWLRWHIHSQVGRCCLAGVFSCGFVSAPGCKQARGSTAAAPGLKLHPGPSRGGCSLGWQGPPLALPPSRCFSSLHRAVFTSWDASAPGDLQKGIALSLLPLEIFSALRCSHGARWAWKDSPAAGCAPPSGHPRAGCHCTVPPGILQPYCFCQHWCVPGSIPAGPAPVLSTSWLHCSGRRIFLALWWFSLMLGLTDEATGELASKTSTALGTPWL